MLKRIFWASVIAGIFCTISLGWISPDVNKFLNLSAEKWDFGPFKLPVLAALVPLAASMIARIITLHDLVSDIFHIREHFDVEHILKPLASGVGVSVDAKIRNKFKVNRHALMRDTFYRYAPDADNTKINPQLVVTALDRWGWFWSMVEPSIIVLIAGVVAWLVVGFMASLVYLVVALALNLAALCYWPSCVRAAQYEVEAILQNANRQKVIHEAFNAI
ncbi:MAG: hypothetical protein U9Q07_07015 [Planctomycetota bacterium]|nr:hypothetical protein [Planctomycetota bacterium]